MFIKFSLSNQVFWLWVLLVVLLQLFETLDNMVSLFQEA